MIRYKHFTPAEKQFIRDSVPQLTNAQIAAALDRSLSSITWQVGQMDVRRVKRWTKEEVAEIRNLAASTTRKNIAAHFGVTELSVKNVMRINKIKTGRSGKFRPGNVPWTKGKKMPDVWAVRQGLRKGSFRTTS